MTHYVTLTIRGSRDARVCVRTRAHIRARVGSLYAKCVIVRHVRHTGAEVPNLAPRFFPRYDRYRLPRGGWWVKYR
jgi:hypothetical protein